MIDIGDVTLDASTSDAIDYRVLVDAGTQGEYIITVTATPKPGYVFDAARFGPGWTGTAENAILIETMILESCLTPNLEAAPVPPQIDPAVCDALGAPVVEQAVSFADGEVVAPSVTLPAHPSSVGYFKQGSEVADGAVEVTASALAGYVFPVVAAGWDVSADGKAAVHIVELADAPECSPGRGCPCSLGVRGISGSLRSEPDHPSRYGTPR